MVRHIMHVFHHNGGHAAYISDLFDATIIPHILYINSSTFHVIGYCLTPTTSCTIRT
jgi:hypothetical protein